VGWLHTGAVTVSVRARAWLTLAASVGLSFGVAVVAPLGGATLSWSVTETPHPPASIPSELFGVACPTVTSCVAVGESLRGTLVEDWNGSSWTRTASPNPGSGPSGRLHRVSCPTTTSCFAVGAYSTPDIAHSFGVTRTLVEHWDGTSWTVSLSPNRVGTQFATLNDVACATTTSCFAVGWDGRTGLIEHWDGIRWSIVTTPSPLATSELWGVSCPTTSSCVAVGDASPRVADIQRTLVEHWNGRRWTVMTGTPSPSNEDALNGVSCPSPDDCFAVGSVAFVSVPTDPPSPLRSTQRSLIEHWNGHGAWSVMLGTPSPSDHTVLASVSCANAKSCFAAGFWSAPLSAASKTVVEHWNGRGAWTIMSSPDPTASSLFALSCPTATSCTAVGRAWGLPNTNAGQRTLVEQYG
jgi:hypothetical protein